MKLLEFTKRFFDEEACETHLKQGLSQDARIDSYLTRNMISKYIHKIALFLLLLTVGVMDVWGQTDYSGTYYIASVGYDGNPANTNNFYLCPTKGWCSYKATDDFEAGDNMPFLTTYRCKTSAYTDGANNAVWYVEKHPTLNYYYIKQASTGRYLTSNGTIRTTNNADRMRVHLESVAEEDLDDKELFTIEAYNNTYLTISPKGVVGGAADRKWLTVNGGNQNSLKGASGKQNGPTGYTNTAGIIGVYTQNDANAPFYLEPALSIDPPTITNNYDGTFTISVATVATIYYTTDGTTPTTSTTTTGTTSVIVNQTDEMTVIKAIAKATNDPIPTIVTTYYLPVCERPAITVSGGTVTITCATAGAAVHYTTDGSPATASSTNYAGPFAKGDATTIRAIATKAGCITSSEAVFLPPTEVSSSSEIIDMNGNYLLTSNFSASGSVGTSDNPFKGTIDGNLNPLTLNYPLVAYADGAIIKNVILESVSISSGTNVGAICSEVTGDSRIYNCGVLGGSVGGSNNVGGIVGLLDGRSRVINCYNYANITSGSNCGGIVGYNNVASTSSNLQTMVMNCMFYGNITGGNAAPIYGGAIIHNKYASSDDTGLNNYCYFLYDEEKNPYVKTIATDKYNGALGAEERFLNRFEFFRMTLNSTRNLAAFYVTGDATQKGEIAKWVLDKSIAPYPILKVQDTYPSIVNPDAEHATTLTERNKGGKLGTLSVTISGTGSGAVFDAPTGASITTGSLTLNITDKDDDNFNYNYRKVQLPYYNEVGYGNYTGGRVVTGWKIVSISGGTAGSFTTGADVTTTVNAETGEVTLTTPYNFVDRKCTNKDLYGDGGSNRVFAQGAYWEVPNGVTAITIEPYWAKAVYLSDANYDVTYNITMSNNGATATATKYGVTVSGSCPTEYNGQMVYTALSTAITNLASNASHTVYDYAVVLVGNYHQADQDALVDIGGKPVTFMSADFDGDNEPDNTLFYYHNQRKRVSPIRFDFLNIPGVGMVKRTYDATMDPEPGIFAPYGWFEITNTVFIRFGQFEYAGSNTYIKKELAPLILQGGIYEQFVSCCRTDATNTNYLLVGGNAWFKNFANGCHTAQPQTTPKVPINVTGGDYTNFYLTGIYQPNSSEPSENAECYIDGGRFKEVAGSGMQQIKGNVTWLINAADITSFFGGGINAAKPITGSISTTISNSYVDEFYGGPKFGDMDEEKTVTTNATDCHFGKFFGAGYGGTAFNRVGYVDDSKLHDTKDWDGYVNSYYKRAYSAGNGGISTNYEYEFILHSDGNQTVARFYVNYASLSLASTRNVTSTLSGCTIGTFYGGGSLGAVNGDVNSTLTNCTVTGNAFGAGFSASVPTVEVWNSGAYLTPNPTYNRTANVFNNASVKTPKDNNQYVEYTWSNDHGSNAAPFTDEGGKHYIYTDVDLEGLGTVTGNVTLIINGTTTVGESVYGGGEESNVAGNTQVNISGGTLNQNVFGGGKGVADNFTCDKAMVGVNNEGACEDPASDANKDKGTKVIINNGTVNGNVYGGGEIGRVEWNTQVTIGDAEGTGTPIIQGNVFGAGKGLETHGYSALVRGNSTVTVQGKAKVGYNVYGGGEKSTVGRYWVKNIPADPCEGETKPTAPGDLPDGMPYQQRSGGICRVTIQGETEIGYNGAADDKGHVFGAGKGVNPHFVASGEDGASQKMTDTNVLVDFADDAVTGKTAEELYLEFLQTLALVTNSSVTIDGSAKVNGSVYGGSESGFVQHDTNVKVQGSNCEIGTTTYGHVFGGGRGLEEFAEAGKVKGNTDVAISAGNVKGNVYGGGELGDVGIIDKSDKKDNKPTYNYFWKQSDGTTANTAEYNGITGTSNNTGICKVTITGGTIGTENGTTANHTSGHVFGAGRGSSNTWWCEKAIVFATNVSVSGSSVVYGNVYGGGQVGRVEDDGKVTIGTATDTGEGSKPDIKGDVFGAGAGVETHGYSALLRGNSEVTVQGIAQVGGSVYGGGEIASVGRFVVVGGLPTKPEKGGTCIVNIKDNAKIGTSGTDHNVFGACKGVTPHYDSSNYKSVYSMQTYENRPNGNAGDTWDYYVTYDEGYTGQKFIKRYYKTEADYLAFLKTLALTSNPHVTIGGTWTKSGSTETITPSGNPSVYGSVYGGGQRGVTLGSVDVNMVGGTVEQDVYGGGALADTNLGNWDVNGYVVATALNQGESITDLYARTGTGTTADPYVYTKITDSGTTFVSGSYYRQEATWAHDEGSAYYMTSVDLIGGTVKGDAYGGGLGQTAVGEQSAIEAKVYGNTTVELNNGVADDAKGCIVKGRIFGCNNKNGSPQGMATVHVYATQNAAATRITNPIGDTTAKVKGRYDVVAVYGGGNEAAYKPVTPYDGTAGSKTQVIIEGCDKTSIETVYGGGNAAAVPETNVTIESAYEIGYLFGGGNGKDKKSDGSDNPGADVGTLDQGTTTYGTGNANTLMKGGLIHEAYGGSNQKGIIKGSINQVTDPKDLEDPDYCGLIVEKIVGAGKYADIDGDVNMTLSCQPSSKVDVLFAGADEANVNGNITLNITNGHFGKVFGGNNLGGAIKGKITVNVEETGCQPIKIDNLYLGSNEAAYSVFGYYESEDIHPVTLKKILKPRVSEDDAHTPVENPATDAKHTFPYAQPELNIISCTYIGNVFGGGLGEGGKMYANPTVNINMEPGLYYNDETVGVPAVMTALGLDASENPDKLGIIENIFGGGDQADIEGNTTVNIATEDGKKAYIIGNVFGGGNGVMNNLDLGKIIGNTHVIIGKASDNVNLSVKNSVYGGGNIGMVTGNTVVDVNNGIIGIEQKGGYKWGNVYGGGKGIIVETEGQAQLEMNSIADVNAGLVKGNTNITINGGTVLHNVYGGGAVGSVGTFTRDANGMPTACAANTGLATVTINGGIIGHNRQDTGMVNGSSRGWEGDPNGTGALAFLNQLAWVNNTNVIIGDATSAAEDVGPSIYGSVYGGGENGHNFGNGVVTVNKGSIGYAQGTWDCGNIYGAGCGTDTYTIGDDPTEHHNPMAGVVRGATTITVNGGHVLRNIYGAGSMGSVGTYTYDANGLPTTCAAGTGKTTININGGVIGTDNSNEDYGHVFGGPKGSLTETEFSASVRETQVNINPHPTDTSKPGANVKGSVFGGGEAGIVKGSVVVNMNGGEVTQDVYGGGALANTNTDNWGTTTWAEGKTAASNTTTVNLKGGKIQRNVYGGALGQTERAADPDNDIEALDDIEAKVYGNVLVELNNDTYVADDAKGCVVLGDIFGCNNLNGTPKGNVMVHIYKTQNIEASRITNAPASGGTPAVEDAKVPGRYDVHAVYGGGNQSAYEPADLTGVNKTEVIIDGCDRTSIRQVYGGGNASSTPATNVTVNGTFEIEELFGGGNGKDNIKINGVTMPNPGANVGYKDYSEYYEEDGVWKVRDKAAYDTKEERMASTDIVYGTGKASVNIYGGTIHRVFGGSNTKGNVRQTAVTLLDEGGECEFCVDEAYGGGKSAEMDAEAQLLLACIPGLQAVYGGAEAADVRGNVTLNITNGTFDRVFGGNNKSGTIGGAITINVEEIGCKPVLIGELYGGGNEAAYSVYGYNADGTAKETGDRLYADPQVNVMSFTSIGQIFGGGFGSRATMVGNPTVNVNVAYGRYYDADVSVVGENAETPNHYPIPSHAKGKMGAINNVFGGGNAAKVIGNTTVNIATLPDVYVVKQVTVGAALPEGCYIRNNNGTYTAATGTAVDGTTYYEKKDVLGADIRGDVYGGGNKAEVTGNANVNVGVSIAP